MINRIVLLLTSILCLSVGALGQVPVNPMGTPASAYKSLSEAVAGIGAAPMTLIISTADFPSRPAPSASPGPTIIPPDPTIVPSTLILEFRGPGTLSLQPGHHVIIQSDGSAWPIRMIFNNANTPPSGHNVRGQVSFSGNKSMREISISWWGALCDNSANDTDAINAALVAGSDFTVTTPANVVCRVGRKPSPHHPESQSPYLQSNTVLRLGANSMFKVSDSADGHSAALAMRDCEYCTVDGGIFDGNSDDAAPAGHPVPASSFAVLIFGGKHLKFLNGRSQNARAPRDGTEVIGNAGDGIYLGIGQEAPQDVIVDKWTSTDNERQAISIIGCRQCRFTNNCLLNTKFAVEGAGMDFEPNPIKHSVSGLALTAGSSEVSSAGGFSADDQGLQIQIGNFHTMITRVSPRNKHNATFLEPSPITATGPSGTITCTSASGLTSARQVTDLYIEKDKRVVTSANESFRAADLGCQIQIGNFHANITAVSVDSYRVNIGIDSTITARGPSGTIPSMRAYRQVTDLFLDGSNKVTSATAHFASDDVHRQLQIGNFYSPITEVRGSTAIVSLAPTQTVIRGTATIRSFEDSRQVNDLVLNQGSDEVTSPTANFTGPSGPRRLQIGDFDALITEVNGQSARISKQSTFTATSASGTISSIKDLRQVTDVSIRADSNELMSPAATFTNADVGRQMKIGDFEALITDVTGDTAIISSNSPLTAPGSSGTISSLRDSRQISDLVIDSNSDTVTSATANFSAADANPPRQIQIGNFYAVITAFIPPNSVKISLNSPFTAARASGTISTLDSRQVTNLVIRSDGLVTSTTAPFTKADENRQIKIGEYYAVIELFKTPSTVRVLVGSHGVSGVISDIKQRFEDVLVDGNTISGNAGPGILFSDINHAPYKGIRFVNNSVRNNQRVGISVAGGNTDGLVVANNTIEGNGNNDGKCVDREQAKGGIGLRIANVDRGASVVGNTIANNDCPGISIAESSHVILADNHIYRNGEAGIYIRPDTSVSDSVLGRNRLVSLRLANLAIHNNSIFNNGTNTAGAYAGLMVNGQADKVIGWEISNNMFGNDAGIFPTATQNNGILFSDVRTTGVIGGPSPRVIVGPNVFIGLLGADVVGRP